jgi:STE24 endopeptidase
MEQLIDQQLQKKARAYRRKKELLGAVQLALTAGYLLAFSISGISGRIAAAVSALPAAYGVPLYLIGLVPLGLLLFPLTLMKDHLLDKRFGMSLQRFGSWLLDQVKGLGLSALVGYPLLLFLFLLFSRAPRLWWLAASGAALGFQVAVSILFPVLIMPLFYRQEPLRDDELRADIERMGERTGISLGNIYSFDLSSKTERENAALAGLWKTRRVLLADTLLKRRPREEILVVLAHEIGHHRLRHMLKSTVAGFCANLALFYCVHRIMSNFPGFPESRQAALALLPVLFLVAGGLAFPLRVLLNAYSRKNEKAADLFALQTTGNVQAFIRLMANLANANLTVADPKKLRVVVSYSHPPVARRIEYARRYDADHANPHNEEHCNEK